MCTEKLCSCQVAAGLRTPFFPRKVFTQHLHIFKIVIKIQKIVLYASMKVLYKTFIEAYKTIFWISLLYRSDE